MSQLSESYRHFYFTNFRSEYWYLTSNFVSVQDHCSRFRFQGVSCIEHAPVILSQNCFDWNTLLSVARPRSAQNFDQCREEKYVRTTINCHWLDTVLPCSAWKIFFTSWSQNPLSSWPSRFIHIVLSTVNLEIGMFDILDDFFRFLFNI